MSNKKIIVSAGVYFAIISTVADYYKKECFGQLIGSKTRKGIETIFTRRPRHTKEKYSTVENYDKSISKSEFALKGSDLEIVGDFHSHTDHKIGRRREHEYAKAIPSVEDIADMEYGNAYLICAVNRSERKVNYCDFTSRYIKQVIDHEKGKLSLTLRAYCLKDEEKAKLLEITLTEKLEKKLNKIKRKTRSFQKKRTEREKQKS